jgi:hypothetical protein
MDEIPRPARVDTPYNPDVAVCPTGAIKRDSNGEARVDAAACFGCGMCVVRCPVGAVSLDPQTGKARVAERDPGIYEIVPPGDGTFQAERGLIAATVIGESPRFADAERVTLQLRLLERVLAGVDAQRAIGLLARNTFLLGGIAARMKNAGDNNAWSELAVDDGNFLMVTELEPGGDVLDALRRGVSGCAVVVSRYGVDLRSVGVCVVLARLPNERVDYYRAARDFRESLGVPVLTLPAAVLLLGVRAGGSGLSTFVRECCSVDDKHNLIVSAVQDTFGDITDPVAAGLLPTK